MSAKISVIIPAYNEEEVIEECLESLSRQTYSDYQVCLIDDQSSDRTKEIIQSFVERYPNRFQLFEYGKVGPGKARNLTAGKLKSEYFAFTDADCVVSENWLENLSQCFQDTNVGSAGGPQLAHPNSNAFQRNLESFFQALSYLIDFYKAPKQMICETAHNPLCNVIYRREVFQLLNGFREDLFPGEDLEMDQRVLKSGYKILYHPQALVYHHRPKNIQEFRKMMFAYGRAQGKLVREMGIQRVLQAIGFIFLSGLLVSLLLGLIFQSLLLIVASLSLGALLFLKINLNSQIGILLNSFWWFRGFLMGFLRNRSEPPGFQVVHEDRQT